MRGDAEAVMVELATVHGPVESAVVRGLLESYGIQVRTASPVPHSILPFKCDGLGEVRVLVVAADAEAARDILARHRRS